MPKLGANGSQQVGIDETDGFLPARSFTSQGTKQKTLLVDDGINDSTGADEMHGFKKGSVSRDYATAGQLPPLGFPSVSGPPCPPVSKNDDWNRYPPPAPKLQSPAFPTGWSTLTGEIVGTGGGSADKVNGVIPPRFGIISNSGNQYQPPLLLSDDRSRQSFSSQQRNDLRTSTSDSGSASGMFGETLPTMAEAPNGSAVGILGNVGSVQSTSETSAGISQISAGVFSSSSQRGDSFFDSFSKQLPVQNREGEISPTHSNSNYFLSSSQTINIAHNKDVSASGGSNQRSSSPHLALSTFHVTPPELFSSENIMEGTQISSPPATRPVKESRTEGGARSDLLSPGKMICAPATRQDSTMSMDSTCFDDDEEEDEDEILAVASSISTTLPQRTPQTPLSSKESKSSTPTPTSNTKQAQVVKDSANIHASETGSQAELPLPLPAVITGCFNPELIPIQTAQPEHGRGAIEFTHLVDHIKPPQPSVSTIPSSSPPHLSDSPTPAKSQKCQHVKSHFGNAFVVSALDNPQSPLPSASEIFNTTPSHKGTASAFFETRATSTSAAPESAHPMDVQSVNTSMASTSNNKQKQPPPPLLSPSLASSISGTVHTSAAPVNPVANVSIAQNYMSEQHPQQFASSMFGTLAQLGSPKNESTSREQQQLQQIEEKEDPHVSATQPLPSLASTMLGRPVPRTGSEVDGFNPGTTHHLISPGQPQLGLDKDDGTIVSCVDSSQFPSHLSASIFDAQSSTVVNEGGFFNSNANGDTSCVPCHGNMSTNALPLNSTTNNSFSAPYPSSGNGEAISDIARVDSVGERKRESPLEFTSFFHAKSQDSDSNPRPNPQNAQSAVVSLVRRVGVDLDSIDKTPAFITTNTGSLAAPTNLVAQGAYASRNRTYETPAHQGTRSNSNDCITNTDVVSSKSSDLKLTAATYPSHTLEHEQNDEPIQNYGMATVTAALSSVSLTGDIEKDVVENVENGNTDTNTQGGVGIHICEQPLHHEQRLHEKSTSRMAVPFVTFGFGGRAVFVSADTGTGASFRTVQLISVGSLLSESGYYKGLANYPGPLTSLVHKNSDSVLNYLQQRSVETYPDCLIYDFLAFLVKNKGMTSLTREGDGTIIQELVNLLISTDDESAFIGVKHSHSASFARTGLQHAKKKQQTVARTSIIIKRITSLMTEGKQAEAVTLAVEEGLWACALGLSSHMDVVVFHRVLARYAKSEFPSEHPMRMLFLNYCEEALGDELSQDEYKDGGGGESVNDHIQSDRVSANDDELYVGRSVCDSVMMDVTHEWRKQLCMLLSNRSGVEDGNSRLILRLGDRLQETGQTHYAHVCYICAGEQPAPLSPDARYSLVGNDLRTRTSFNFPNSSIQLTEVYEYATALNDARFALPPLQPFKLVYAARIADVGMVKEAMGYCDAIIQAVKTSKADEACRMVYTRGFLETLHAFHERLVIQLNQDSNKSTRRMSSGSGGMSIGIGSAQPAQWWGKVVGGVEKLNAFITTTVEETSSSNNSFSSMRKSSELCEQYDDMNIKKQDTQVSHTFQHQLPPTIELYSTTTDRAPHTEPIRPFHSSVPSPFPSTFDNPQAAVLTQSQPPQYKPMNEPSSQFYATSQISVEKVAHVHPHLPTCTPTSAHKTAFAPLQRQADIFIPSSSPTQQTPLRRELLTHTVATPDAVIHNAPASSIHSMETWSANLGKNISDHSGTSVITNPATSSPSPLQSYNPSSTNLAVKVGSEGPSGSSFNTETMTGDKTETPFVAERLSPFACAVEGQGSTAPSLKPQTSTPTQLHVTPTTQLHITPFTQPPQHSRPTQEVPHTTRNDLNQFEMQCKEEPLNLCKTESHHEQNGQKQEYSGVQHVNNQKSSRSSTSGDANKVHEGQQEESRVAGWFGAIKSWLPVIEPHKEEDPWAQENTIHWNPVEKKWVDTAATPEPEQEQATIPPPPPVGTYLAQPPLNTKPTSSPNGKAGSSPSSYSLHPPSFSPNHSPSQPQDTAPPTFVASVAFPSAGTGLEGSTTLPHPAGAKGRRSRYVPPPGF
eukprot:CFRG6941T1